jgi:acyl carrier protein
MERAEIESKILEIIKDKIALREIPQPDQLFTPDIGMDSLDHVEVLMAIEDEFDMEIEDFDAMKLKSPKDAIDYVVSKFA